MPRRPVSVVLAGVIVALAGSTRGVFAEDTSSPAAPVAPAAERTVRFAFKEAPLDQVIDFFARETGLPVIRETDLPSGPVTFISDQAYPLGEALRVLNTILQTKGVMLRQDARFLYLQKLENMKAEAVRTFDGPQVPDDVRDDEVVSMVIRLNNAPAKTIAEQLGTLVAGYGSLVALPQQNAVVLTETGGQCRRLGSIIAGLDARPAFEESVKVFPLQHTLAADILGSLKVLVAEKKTTVVVDPDGKRKTIAEDDMAGVRLEADARTNSVIALGATGRLTTIETLVHLLDVPSTAGAGSGGRTMATIALASLDANEAASRVRELFAGVPQDRQPTIVPLVAASKLVVLGTDTDAERARALIREADFAGPMGDLGDTRTVVVPVRYISAGAAAEVLARLATPRQQRMIRIAPGPDGRSLVLAGPTADVEASRQLLAQVDVDPQGGGVMSRSVRVLRLGHADAAAVAGTVSAMFEAETASAEPRPTIRVDTGSNALVVRGTAAQLLVIETVAKQIDGATLASSPDVRAIAVDRSRADAAEVAETVRQMIEKRGGVKVRVISADELLKAPKEPAGAPGSSTDPLPGVESARGIILLPPRIKLIIGYVQVLLATADQAPERVGPPAGLAEDAEVTIAVDPDTNTLIVVGSERLTSEIAALVKQVQQGMPAEPVRVTIVQMPSGVDAGSLAAMVNQTLAQVGRASNDNPGGLTGRVSVVADPMGTSLVVAANDTDLAAVRELVGALAKPGMGELPVRSVKLERADAQTVATALQRFFDDRAKASSVAGQRTATRRVAVTGDRRSSTLVVAASDEDFEQVKSLIETFDAPTTARDLQFRVIPLKHTKVADVREVVEGLAGELQWGGYAQGKWADQARPDAITLRADPRTNSIIVMGEGQAFDAIEKIVAAIDTPRPEQAAVTAKVFKVQRADLAVVQRAAQQAFTDPTRASRWWEPQDPTTLRFEIDQRTRSLVVIGPATEFDRVAALIEQLDAQPPASDTQYRVVALSHASAGDIAQTLRALWRRRPGENTPAPSVTSSIRDNTLIVAATADQFAELETILKELDVPAKNKRLTEFVPLEHANAAQTREALSVFYGRFAPEAGTPAAKNVSIVADPASNSLVISAEEGEWRGLRELLSKLDSEQYDASRQLEVIALKNADARSVATAIQRAFDAPLRAEVESERERAREEARRRGDRQGEVFSDAPAVLVNADEVVSVSAEPLTNSLVVSAGRKNIARIKAIVERLDVPDFANLPEPRVLPLKTGKASELATALRQMYEQSLDNRGGGQGTRSLRSIAIVGDDASNTLIVRAEEEEFTKIKSLADAIQQEGMLSRVQVRVMALHSQPAARLAQTVLKTFTASAQQNKEPLAVEADRRTNALVIASSQRLYEEIEKVVRELDGAPPKDGEAADASKVGMPGQGLFIIDVNNTSPEEIKRLLDQMGVTKEQSPERPGIVAEPVTVIPLTTRRAVAVLAAPGDGASVIELVKAMDANPAMPEQEVAIVPLKTGEAQKVATALEQMLSVTDNDAKTKLASAVTEQVRRLALRGEKIDDKDVTLDLSVPIRVQAEAQSNSLILTSSPANIEALRVVVPLLDRLPVGDSVLVRIFHLDNASADRTAGVIRELFRQGEAIRRVPGSVIRGVPTTETGRALAGEIALSTDARTNALIVAGREEAVALAEVLVKQLDSQDQANWIEPKLIGLRYADATKLAQTLNRVLVEGMNDVPESAAIKEQFGRLRILREGSKIEPGKAIEANLFARLTQLRVLAEENLNALIVVGSTANVEVVATLVSMLDVEAASRFDSVRVYPLTFAAADRVGDILKGLFKQQVANDALRKEDDVVVQSDARSNALIVATSARSFAVVENLIKTLDAQGVHATVGLHILPAGRNDARTLAPKIERLMRDRLSAMKSDVRSDRDVVSIQADEATNTLIVACSDENLAIITGMMDVLASNDFDAGQTLEIFSLRSAKAGEMVTLLDDLYVREEVRTRGQGALKVRADDRLNAVVVNGTEGDITRIRDLVDKLDGAALSNVREIRIIPLKASNSIEMVSLLENVLSGRPVGGARGASSRQATILRFARDAAALRLQEAGKQQLTEADISAGIREQVSLTPDVRTNSVIASAPTSMMLMIEALVEDLETSASGSRSIEVYTLQNADAEQMGELLRDLFNLRQQGNLYVLVPNGQTDQEVTGPPVAGAPAAAGVGFGDMSLSVVPDERQQLAITVDARTNSLLVSGTREYLDLVGDVVNRLDGQKGEERQQITYELKNARVDEVAQALQTFMQQEQDRVARTLGPDRAGSILRRLEKEISVVGVPGSSRLILSASPRYMEKVTALVEELDRAPAQVLIQVLLAEVTLDTEGSWGVDFKLRPQGSRMLEGALRAAGTGVATAIGVPNLSVSTLDFDLLIRALEAQGRLDVLSRPQILVNDNEEANIQIGEEIQLVTNIQRTLDGGTVSDVTPRQVGVILNVTPSISPDGYVRLDIAPEISSLTARTTQISEDFSAPVIDQRKADTTVTVRDGQTIVIGGLIQNRSETRKTKVPILGDIPILGLPFRSEKSTTAKTELLIILTPRVVMTDRDLRSVSIEEIDRLTLPEDIKDAIKNNAVSGETILPQDPRRKKKLRDDVEGSPFTTPPKAPPP